MTSSVLIEPDASVRTGTTGVPVGGVVTTHSGRSKRIAKRRMITQRMDSIRADILPGLRR
jgi:hypothetical protein